MAFKDTQTLTCLLVIWLNVIEVSTFLTFSEDRINSVGSFNKHERAMESFESGDSKTKSGAQIGRLVIGPSRTPNDGRLSSDVSSFDLPRIDKNAYQSDDAGLVNLQPLWGQIYGLNTLYTPAVEQLLGMKPKIDCAGDLMKLTIHGRDASFGSNFLIDRGSISPLPLSRLPSECGHTLLRTYSNFVFTVPYDGCYVSQERNMYILSLLWWGLPVRMSCSSSTLAQSSPTVSCYTNGMIVKLQRDAAVNLRVKVMNEWHPLMKASAKCGYSLVSHPEGMVIHAPYMPCIEAKDGMFTLSMATEREFNLSCPALSLSLPVTETKADTSIPHSLVSSTLAPTTAASVETTKPTESQTTLQKIFPTPLPYLIPGHPYFKPVSPNYPFLLFHPNVPPTVAPFRTKAVTPSPVTQGPQTPIYPKPVDPKPPQTWYPWYPKPNLVPDLTQSSPVLPPREPLVQPIEAPKPTLSPLVHLPKPTGIPLRDKTTPRKPPAQWAPMYPPSKLVFPLYPRKPEFVNASSVALGQVRPGKPVFIDSASRQVPQWLLSSQTRPRPNEPPRLKPSEQQALPKPEATPPVPAPTKKPESLQVFHLPWYKPYPQQHLKLPSVPTKVPYVTKVFAPQPQPFKHPDSSTVTGPPLRMHFDFTTGSYPTSAPSKSTEVTRPSTPPKGPLTRFNLPHALFRCPTFCPGPPSISYHHHNHHHFGHPVPVPYPGTSSSTKFTAEIQSSPGSASAPFPFIQAMGYNYSPYSSKIETLPQYVPPTKSPFIKPTPDTESLIRPTLCPYIFRTLASNPASSQPEMKPVNILPFIRPWEPTKPLSGSSQNAPIAESVAHSVQRPSPALFQAEIQHYIPQERYHMPTFVAPHNAGPSQSEHDVSLKPTTSPADDKRSSRNYWYQAASYPRPPMSDAPSEISKQASLHDHNSLRSTTPPQPTQTRDMDLPMQLNVQNGKSSVPLFRDPEPLGSYWVPAVQSNQKTVHSTHYPDDSMGGPLRFVLRQMERMKQH